MIEMQTILNIFTIIAIMGIMQIFRAQQRITAIQCDKDDISAADYTIMISNIPKNVKNNDYKKYLKDIIEEKYPRKEINGLVFE